MIKADVATIQSLVRKGVVKDCVADYGHLIVDECHHLSARSFELVARRAKAKFVTGLSATVTRKDGHHPIIFMQCGPVRHRVDAKSEAVARPFSHTVHVRPTSFRPATIADPDMRMQFQLNAELPIPFDGWGKMEVDLLCDSARLAIELDGEQHLANADAYRRDRRKDALLQEHDYLVLRFLTEDMGQRLDAVLDAILRALSHRNV